MSTKISGYADGGALQATDDVVIARSGNNFKITGNNIASSGLGIPDAIVDGVGTDIGRYATVADATNASKNYVYVIANTTETQNVTFGTDTIIQVKANVTWDLSTFKIDYNSPGVRRIFKVILEENAIFNAPGDLFNLPNSSCEFYLEGGNFVKSSAGSWNVVNIFSVTNSFIVLSDTAEANGHIGTQTIFLDNVSIQGGGSSCNNFIKTSAGFCRLKDIIFYDQFTASATLIEGSGTAGIIIQTGTYFLATDATLTGVGDVSKFFKVGAGNCSMIPSSSTQFEDVNNVDFDVSGVTQVKSSNCTFNNIVMDASTEDCLFVNSKSVSAVTVYGVDNSFTSFYFEADLTIDTTCTDPRLTNVKIDGTFTDTDNLAIRSGNPETEGNQIPSEIIGNPGTESSGINVQGSTFDSAFKVSDIGGSFPAQFLMHKHSTTLQALILGSRSNSDTTAHADVTNSMTLFTTYAAGWAGSNYKLFGGIHIDADSTGTISNTSAPGRIRFQVTPDSSVTPADAMLIRNDKTIEIPYAHQYTNASNPTHAEALAFYDNDEHALSYYNDDSNVTVNIGQENLTRVYNNSGSLIPDGSVVYITGAEGTEGRATIDLAIATASSTSQVLGVVTADIANNGFGYVTQFGNVNNIDTSSFSAGDTLFLSDTVAGDFQSTSPVSPSFSVFLGYVLVSNATTGRIFITALGNTGGTAAGDATEVTKIVRKGTPGTINAGEVVYISGYNVGQSVPEVELANSGSASTMPAVGIANSTITNSSNGGITISGQISGIDTSSFTAGDELYVDTTDGQLTTTKPVSNDAIQKVGICLRSNASNGVILVIGAGRSNDVPNFTAADKFWYGGTGGAVTEGDITSAGRALIDDASASAQRTTLGVDPTPTVSLIDNTDSPVTAAIDTVYSSDANAGNIVINLPAIAAGNSGKKIQVIVTDTNTGTNTVTINRNGTDTINGGTSLVLTTDNEPAILMSDGVSNWMVLSNA